MTKLHPKVVFCTHCGRSFGGGKTPNSVQAIRQNTGMSVKEAVRKFAPVYRTKAEMAYQFGISRNSLYEIIERFNLQDVKFLKENIDPVKAVEDFSGMSVPDAVAKFAPIFLTKTEMAKRFGISRKALYDLIEQFDLYDIHFPVYAKGYANAA